MTYTGLPVTGGNSSKSATGTTASPANSAIVEHIKISSNQFLIVKNKSLETIENSSIITIFTSDNFFLKPAFILLLKSSNFTPGLIPRPEWTVAPQGEHVVYLFF